MHAQRPYSSMGVDPGVHPETLRVLLRPKEGASRSGPGFWVVARLASALKLDLTSVARSALAAGKAK